MKKKLISLMLFFCALSLNAQVERPKLVVGLVVDQMRWDYLYYFYEYYGNNGLKRLINDGFSCDNTMLNYTPTFTAVGHTSIYTGSVPAFHGIAGNDFRLNNKMVYCCTDTTVQSVGSDTKEGQMSPCNLLTTTIGDMMKFGINNRSKVIGVALKDRAAILPAGHAADAAYWWDTKAGCFVSSTFYMKELPGWVKRFNTNHHSKPGFDMKGSVDGIKVTFDMAEATLQNENMGRGRYTDMLCVSVSSTDALGHAFGTRRPEMKEAYLALDKQIAGFLETLDSQEGRGNYLIFLTADHGVANNPNEMKAHKIPAGGYDGDQVRKNLNNYLQQKFGVDNLAKWNSGFSIFLNLEAIEQSKLNIEDVKAKAIEFLKKDPQFLYVIDMENIASSNLPAKAKDQLTNGYNRQRSGEIQMIAHPNYQEGRVNHSFIGTTHGSWYPYDSHIPLIFMGWKVKPGKTNALNHVTDIAPTVCSMLHVQMPDACIGDAIVQVTDQK